jgi:hypothetical protein
MPPKPEASSAVKPVGRTRVPSHVHARLFDGDLVILDLANGEYFSLDPIGARMWEGLAAGLSVHVVAVDIAQKYDVALDRALADLGDLVEQLVSRGLLVVDDAREP